MVESANIYVVFRLTLSLAFLVSAISTLNRPWQNKFRIAAAILIVAVLLMIALDPSRTISAPYNAGGKLIESVAIGLGLIGMMVCAKSIYERRWQKLD